MREVSRGRSSDSSREGPNVRENFRTVSVEDEWRQMTFEDLLPGNRGEAPNDRQRDESSLGSHESEDSGREQLLEAVLERRNLQSALKRVKKNRGGPGIDGMTVQELGPWLREHWLEVKEALVFGHYRPQPVKRQEIPKPGGGIRELGIPTVLDRFIQQALLQVLQPRIDPSFSEYSYGFRPGKSAQGAVRQAQTYIQEGRRVVVDVDLEKFFDRVNHDVLMGKLEKRIEDRRILRLIRRYLVSGVMANGVLVSRHEGTPQGGPLSPLLANVLLDDVDQELERRGHAFVRYADDGQVYVNSRRAGKRVLALLRRLYGKLRLRINETKSAVGSAFRRDFLGFAFWAAPGKRVKLRVAKKALVRMQDRVRSETRRNGGRSIATTIGKLRSFLLGWKGYFRIADTPGIMRELDGWIRRRLRALHLKHWKRGPTAFGELRNRGASVHLAARIAVNVQRWWWNSKLRLHHVFTLAYFDELGLPRLAQGTST